MDNNTVLTRRKLPKLMACLTKTSLENMRNQALYSLEVLDAKGIRRRKLALHECLALELREAGFTEASSYLDDLIYDNIQLVDEDDVGIVVDLRKRHDYLEYITSKLQLAEKNKEKGNTKQESIEFLNLALYYAEKGKGILWLAEKFFNTSIAVSSQYILDAGRQKAVCKYHYAKFLLDKFPGAGPEESFEILTEVRNSAIGKKWALIETEHENEEVPSPDTVFCATAILLHRVLLYKARDIKKKDAARAERLARLAERRARDAEETVLTAEAIIEIGICQLMMNNLNNAQRTFERAFRIYSASNDISGLCSTRMHLAAVMQRLGDHTSAARLLTEMGALAMQHGLRRLLGRALHLLGELHLRRERPELGTQHLGEAFACFMGFGFQNSGEVKLKVCSPKKDDTEIEEIYSPSLEIYEEDAEQSRLMMAISAGQELMGSYFKLIREARYCAVAQMKVIGWKLSKAGWWVKQLKHDLMPCMCPVHQRTPLDVLRIQLDIRSAAAMAAESSIAPLHDTVGTQEDLSKLRSSFQMTEI